jgi:hypothetical protein
MMMMRRCRPRPSLSVALCRQEQGGRLRFFFLSVGAANAKKAGEETYRRRCETTLSRERRHTNKNKKKFNCNEYLSLLS